MGLSRRRRAVRDACGIVSAKLCFSGMISDEVGLLCLLIFIVVFILSFLIRLCKQKL